MELVTLSTDLVGRVLVVDDDGTNRQLLRDLLESRGHTVLEAESGEEGLREVVAQMPEVVLLDVMMSGLDGFEVCRLIKADSRTAAIPVLLITALSDRSHRIQGIEAGANDFLTKPIDTRDVMLRVRNAVHLKQIHDQLQESYEELRRLEALRDNLTHLIVHDLKAPLGGVAGYLELLLMEAEEKLTDEEKSFVDEAHDAAQRVIRMVSALLDVSRLEAKEMPIVTGRADLGKTIERAVKDVRALAAGKSIEIELPARNFDITCDDDLIQRVITNLVENAIKYAPQDGLIRVTAEAKEDGARIAITDNGPGIPPEYHDKIFEKFGQVLIRKQKKLFSTGLGLAFCKLAVEAHGGTIGVISKEDQGSTFWFTLPYEAETTAVQTTGAGQGGREI